MKIGDLVMYNQEPKTGMWLSSVPEPANSSGPGLVHGGELLIILEKNKEHYYTRVLTTSGVSGWIYTGYLKEA